MTMINFLNSSHYAQNMQNNQNMLYMRLTELNGPFSPDIEKANQECIAACEKSMENFTSHYTRQNPDYF